jgi:hypothetical protein
MGFSGVKLRLSSGAQRDVEYADAARVDGLFFIVTRWYSDLNRRETVLTVRTEDIVVAEIFKDGRSTHCVLGGGGPK